ncbi:head-tail connector protein, partial [Bacillus pumilus]
MVLTLEEAKKYLRVDGDEDDDLIASFIEAAEIYIKNA